MNIKGGVIVPYCKTRWTTAYQSIDDVLRVKVILEDVSKNNYIIYTVVIILLINFYIIDGNKSLGSINK
jgi:hypothetical protein